MLSYIVVIVLAGNLLDDQPQNNMTAVGILLLVPGSKARGCLAKNGR